MNSRANNDERFSGEIARVDQIEEYSVICGSSRSSCVNLINLPECNLIGFYESISRMMNLKAKCGKRARLSNDCWWSESNVTCSRNEFKHQERESKDWSGKGARLASPGNVATLSMPKYPLPLSHARPSGESCDPGICT